MFCRWPPAFVSLPFVLALSAQAQQAGDGWLDSAAAREFRGRVAELAVIYGDSRGIDPRGLLVIGQRIEDAQAGCADVDIQVLAASQEVLMRERVRACRHGSGR